ncbi:MAG: AAA family ATPase [Frankiaceae bacterium]|nr:AAA family ATPase [Frankiaceae bacterium]MBV9871037.1 AAA family ATPase [Frankiaceae bacterium]
MGRNAEIAREQEIVARLYGRLDALREEARLRLYETLGRGASGTHQNRSERDLFAGMYGARIAQLDAVEPGLCFGRLDLLTSERLHIGRIGLTDERHDTLLVDWRAPAAEPFYRATPAEPAGVVRRRHLRTKGRRVLDVEDDVFDVDDLTDADRETLGGGGALLAALNETRTGRMRDIVATIQAEQDRIIRADPSGVLVVQGGPGTGKTAVALHRAAYLLYTHRERLARTGVLVVGPGPAFVRYIEQVLPSLGETGVLLSTLDGLIPGIEVKATDSEATASLKAELRMTDLLEAAVMARQRVPDTDRVVHFEEHELVLTPQDMAIARARARRSRRRHNRARYAFAKQLLRFLVARLAETDEELSRERWVLRTIMADDEFRAIVDECWPRLTAAELVADLFTPAGLAGIGSEILTDAERRLLVREPGSPWASGDVPLLDEAWALLGDPEEVLRVAAERRALRADREYAQQVIAATGTKAHVDADTLAERYAGGPVGRAVVDRAANDPDWEYGHLIVDEAQELSPMAWRMLARRCPLRSMTVVGDVDQASAPWALRSWPAALQPVAPDRWRVESLSVNYRTPAEIMAVAADVLAAADPNVSPPSSVREAGFPPSSHQVPPTAHIAEVVADVVAQSRAAIGDGKLAVITPDRWYDGVVAAVMGRFEGEVATGAAGLDSPIAILDATEAKGLEFDAVVLVEPADWIRDHARGLRELYVALTRATQRLDVVHADDLPTVLGRLTPA